MAPPAARANACEALAWRPPRMADAGKRSDNRRRRSLEGEGVGGGLASHASYDASSVGNGGASLDGAALPPPGPTLDRRAASPTARMSVPGTLSRASLSAGSDDEHLGIFVATKKAKIRAGAELDSKKLTDL